MVRPMPAAIRVTLRLLISCLYCRQITSGLLYEFTQQVYLIYLAAPGFITFASLKAGGLEGAKAVEKTGCC